MPLVIQAVQEYSWHDAFSSYDFLPDLVQTDSTLDWLIQRLDGLRRSRSGMAEHVREAVTDAIVNADTNLLAARLRSIMSMASLDREAQETILERIEIASSHPDQSWRRLEAHLPSAPRAGLS
jgi:hypothetical protein